MEDTKTWAFFHHKIYDALEKPTIHTPVTPWTSYSQAAQWNKCGRDPAAIASEALAMLKLLLLECLPERRHGFSKNSYDFQERIHLHFKYYQRIGTKMLKDR